MAFVIKNVHFNKKFSFLDQILIVTDHQLFNLNILKKKKKFIQLEAIYFIVDDAL